MQICEEFNVAVLVTNQVRALKTLHSSKAVQHIVEDHRVTRSIIANCAPNTCPSAFQVVSDPGGGAMFVSDPKKPVGGHVVGLVAQLPHNNLSIILCFSCMDHIN